MEKIIQGVGVRDTTEPVIRKIKGKVVWKCPYYKRWNKILQRCYNERDLLDNPTYRDVTVCDEWLRFSVFRDWMKNQTWILADGTALHIDKDLLIKGNKVYSPYSCTFLHPKVNNFMTECKNFKKFEDIGYKKRVYETGNVRFQARCCNPFRAGKREADSLGCFDTEHEAHLAWKERKLYYAKLLVERGYTLSEEQSSALIKRYS